MDGLSNTAALSFTKSFPVAPTLESVTLSATSAPIFGSMSMTGELQTVTTSGADLQLTHVPWPFGTPTDRPLTSDGNTATSGEISAFQTNSDLYFARANSVSLNGVDWFKSTDGAAALSLTSPVEAFTASSLTQIGGLVMYPVGASTLVAIVSGQTDNLGTRMFQSTDSGANWAAVGSPGTLFPTVGDYSYLKYLGSVDGTPGQVSLLTKRVFNTTTSWILLSSADGLSYDISPAVFVVDANVGFPSTDKNGTGDTTMFAMVEANSSFIRPWRILDASTVARMEPITILRPDNAAACVGAYLTADYSIPTLYAAEADTPFEVKIYQNTQTDGDGSWGFQGILFTPDAVVNNMQIAKVPGILFMIYHSDNQLYSISTTDLSGLTGWSTGSVFASGAAPNFTIVQIDNGTSFGVTWFRNDTNDLQWTLAPGTTVATVEWTVQG